MKLSQKVKIINPVENGSAITSRKKAVQFVQAGKAVFLGDNFIRFVENDPRNQAVTERAASGCQDVNRMMSKAEIANIPFARPGRAFRAFLTNRPKIACVTKTARRLPFQLTSEGQRDQHA
jgi:hypothetical protein